MCTLGTLSPSLSGVRFARAAAAIALCLGAGAGVAVAQPVIRELPIPSGGTYSSALALGLYGSVTVGAGGTAGSPVALRWIGANPPQTLGILPGGWYSVALGVSTDGSVVTGYGSTASGDRAYRWTAATGLTELPLFAGAIDSFGLGINTAGDTIVGVAGTMAGDRAFVWTLSGGMLPIPMLAGGLAAQGTAVSGDGRIVVGHQLTATGFRAFRWSSAEGVQALQTLSPDRDSYAFAVNADGAVIAGHGMTTQGVRALRWENGEPLSLGVVPGCTASYGVAVNGEGTRIAGYCNHPGNNIAFLWTPAAGMVDLNAYLPTLGLDLSGWTLHQALAISPDGAALAGFGRLNGEFRGWVITGLSECTPAAAVVPPQNLTICRGGAATFSITAAGTGPLTFQWRFQGVPIDPLTNPSAASTMLELPAITLDMAGMYDCIVTNACGTATSAAAELFPCAADYNCSGTVSVQDLFDFLAGYFSDNPFADLNLSGAITVQDLFDFLTAYFTGCA